MVGGEELFFFASQFLYGGTIGTRIEPVRLAEPRAKDRGFAPVEAGDPAARGFGQWRFPRERDLRIEHDAPRAPKRFGRNKFLAAVFGPMPPRTQNGTFSPS